MHPLVENILDEGTAQELHAHWAPNIVTALGRFGGRTVGVVANNPLRLGGCLDSLSAEKACRFVRLCDSLGVPLIVVVDVPGRGHYMLTGVRDWNARAATETLGVLTRAGVDVGTVTSPD